MRDQLPKKIGVITIGRNEGDRLKLCLRSVPFGVPIIYVDSGSTDHSVEFAKAIGAQVVELDMTQPFTAARARNAGLEHLVNARDDIELVQFVDGDCELQPGWLESGQTFLMVNSNAAAVCGRRKERFPQASLYNAMCDEEWNTPIGQAKACGGDAMFRLSAICDVGKYDAAIVAGEEPELCQRLRSADWSIWRLDEPMTLHDADMHHTKQWWIRAIRSGFGTAQVWHKTVFSIGDTLNSRQLISALFWTFGVAFLTAVAVLVIGPVGVFLIFLIWLTQILRLAGRLGFVRAVHVLGGKVAETIGILRYLRSWLTGRKQGAILYK